MYKYQQNKFFSLYLSAIRVFPTRPGTPNPQLTKVNYKLFSSTLSKCHRHLTCKLYFSCLPYQLCLSEHHIFHQIPWNSLAGKIKTFAFCVVSTNLSLTFVNYCKFILRFKETSVGLHDLSCLFTFLRGMFFSFAFIIKANSRLRGNKWSESKTYFITLQLCCITE